MRNALTILLASVIIGVCFTGATMALWVLSFSTILWLWPAIDPTVLGVLVFLGTFAFVTAGFSSMLLEVDRAY